MKIKLPSALALLMYVVATSSCSQHDTSSNDSKDANEPELAMYVLALMVVDDTSGKPVPRISGVNYKHSQEFFSESFRSSNAVSRASSRMIAGEEGIVFASWIGPTSSPGQLVITANGYESMLVDPTIEEKHIGRSDSIVSVGDLASMTRTIRMKKSEQAAPSNR